jgi:hypothetical protein
MIKRFGLGFGTEKTEMCKAIVGLCVADMLVFTSVSININRL